MPVWLANDTPKVNSRSASFMNQLAMGVPERPSTPQASGWRSPISPLPLKVVATGAPICSANFTMSGIPDRAPWPTMIRGRAAPATAETAAASASAGGSTVRSPVRPWGVPADLSGAGRTCTSSGSTKWATSRSTMAVLQARVISSA